MGIERELTLVACSLSPDDLAARAERWRVLRSRAALETVPISRGLRLIFRDEPGVADEVEELVALERECCAFAAWAVSAENGRVVLEVTGDSNEATRAVQAMLV